MIVVETVLFDCIFWIMCLLVAKCCYNSSIVADKWSILGIFSVSLFHGIWDAVLQDSMPWNIINKIICFGMVGWCLFRGGSGKRKRITAFLEAMLNLVFGLCSVCGIVTICLFPEWEPGKNDEAVTLLYTALGTLILLYVFFKLYRKGICIRFGGTERALLLVFNILAIFIWTFFVMQKEGELTSAEVMTMFHFLFAVGITILYIIFLAVLVKHRLSVYYRQGQEYQREWMERELSHFTEYKVAQEETRRFRHDVVNNLTCIEALLQEEKTNEAKEYVKTMLGTVRALSPRVVTGDEMLDCIIASKWDIMKQLEITFSYDGVFDHRLTWQPMDICSVFANALDNAIEACAKIQGKRWISFCIRHTDHFYYVELVNSCLEDGSMIPPNEKRYTTKKNAEFHGYGLENIQKTLGKYDGDMKLDSIDGRFILSMTIPF